MAPPGFFGSLLITSRSFEICKGGKTESFIEGIQKSSPPFEKGGREGFLGMPFQNGVTASVGARGPERNAPEASVGLPLDPEDPRVFPPEGAGGIFPAQPPEKSTPYDSKRAGQAPGPWNPLALTPYLFSKS
jgi:hypothetical protein